MPSRHGLGICNIEFLYFAITFILWVWNFQVWTRPTWCQKNWKLQKRKHEIMKLNKIGWNYLPLQLIPFQLNPESQLGLTLTESLTIIKSEEVSISVKVVSSRMWRVFKTSAKLIVKQESDSSNTKLEQKIILNNSWDSLIGKRIFRVTGAHSITTPPWHSA